MDEAGVRRAVVGIEVEVDIDRFAPSLSSRLGRSLRLPALLEQCAREDVPVPALCVLRTPAALVDQPRPDRMMKDRVGGISRPAGIEVPPEGPERFETRGHTFDSSAAAGLPGGVYVADFGIGTGCGVREGHDVPSALEHQPAQAGYERDHLAPIIGLGDLPMDRGDVTSLVDARLQRHE